MKLEGIKILIVDDELDIQEFIQYNLNKEGVLTETASNGLQALDKITSFQPDLILLDIMMPEMDGIETCQAIRSNPVYDNIVVAFLTARSEDYSQVAALDNGGDDFIAKPIRPKVLLSRIKALMRRKNRLSDDSKNKHIMTLGDFVIDKEKVSFLKGGEEIYLVKREFEIVCLLASKPGRVFGREEIFRKIWGDDVFVGNRTIDVHIRKIREKIGQEYIKTIKGFGYKFDF